MVVVAVIDNGINNQTFLNLNVIRYLEVMSDLSVIENDSHHLSKITHGTICGAIIQKFAPSANLVSIKITNNLTSKSTVEQLITAMEWCTDNNIKIINLSMGTVDYRDFEQVGKVIETLVSKGIIIVAAYHNSNILTYPASHSKVFGVKSDRSGLLHDNQFIFEKGKKNFTENNLIANSNFKFTNSEGSFQCIEHSNSFAAPVITSAIYKVLNEHPEYDLCSIRHSLFRTSLKGCSVVTNSLIRNNCNYMAYELDIPVIAISYQSDGPFFLASEISNLFKKSGYCSLVFSDNESEIHTSGAIPLSPYLNGRNITLNTLQILKRIYDPDIIIISIRKNRIINKKLIDIFLYERADRIIMETLDKCTAIRDSAEEAYTQILHEYIK